MNKDFQRWLNDYDSRRTDPDRQFRIPSAWHSSKYDLENMSWDEIRGISIPELRMTWGSACEAMRKSWFHYKMLKREGDKGWDIILRINRIQRGLGLEMTEFRDGPDLSWVKQQLDLEEGTGVESSSEDLELRYEEENQDRPWTDGTEETDEPEDPEYAILRQEEREAALADVGLYPGQEMEEKENDDWF
ncbi:MAG: hypothetical protein WA364_11950 [Candidatus Nitrosopolaris sp.]